jgi:hypothetical protein
MRGAFEDQGALFSYILGALTIFVRYTRAQPTQWCLD